MARTAKRTGLPEPYDQRQQPVPYLYLIKMQPIRTDGATSVFSIEQVMLHGEPCYYGFVDYIVLSSLDYERPLRTDYKFEQDRERVRSVHRYDRVKRFEWVLYQILGYRGELPDEVIELCTGCDLRSTHIWASIQAILKS